MPPLIPADNSTTTQRETALRHQTQLVQILQQATTIASSDSNFAQVAQMMFEVICTQLDWQLGYVYRTTDTLPQAVVPTELCHVAAPEKLGPTETVVKLVRAINIPTKILATQQSLWVSDVAIEPNFLDAATATTGLHAAVAFPVHLDTEIVVVVAFFATKPRELDMMLVGLLNYIGVQLSGVIERQRAAYALQQSGAELERRVAERTEALRSVNQQLQWELAERKRAEAALGESELKFRTLVEQIPAVTYLAALDEMSSTLYVSPQIETFLGFSQREWLADHTLWLKQVHPDDQDRVLSQVREAQRTGIPSPSEYRVLSRHGQNIWFRDLATIVKNQAGQPQFLQGIMLDISEQKRTEEQLRFQAGLLNAVGQAVIATALDGTIIYWNRAAKTLYGWDTEDVIGRNILDVTVTDQSAAQAREILDQLRVGDVWSGEFLVQRRDGSSFPALVTNTPLQDDHGQLIGVIGVSVDLTERKRSEAALQQAQQQVIKLFERITDGFFALDHAWQFTYINPQAECLMGRTAAELIGMNIWDAFPELVGTCFEAQYRIAAETQVAVDFEAFNTSVAMWWDVRVYPSHDGLSVYFRDVTERKRNDELRAQIVAIVESSDDAIIGQTLNGTILSWNAAAERIYGYTAAEMLNCSMALLWPPDHSEELTQMLQQLAAGGRISAYETTCIRKDGQRITVSLTVSPIKDSSGALIGASAISRDITARKQAEAQLLRMAFHDPLTGLPNRVWLVDQLRRAITRAQHDAEAQIAVLVININRFKLVNESIGHGYGNQLLRAIAERLMSGLRQGDVLARLGSDEFVLVAMEINDERDANERATRLHEVLAASFMLDDHELFITVNIGIALSRLGYEQPEDVLRAADTALNRAKALGPGRHVIFDRAMHAQVLARVQLEADLRRAVEREQLHLVYQPIVSLASNTITAVEALIRWQHPTWGFVSPTEFIPIAEETGLIVPLGEWILHTACAQAAAWHRAGHRHLVVAVNLSGRQFKQLDLVSVVDQTLRDTKLSPAYLKLELTENVAMDDAVASSATFQQLRTLGVRIAIDDFGTGYSSLSYLKRFPIDTLKIDRSFIRDIPTDPNDAAIANAIIAMAHSLHLEVVAEGVETEEQLAFLRQHGCDAIQGYLISRPQTAASTTALLHTKDRLHGKRISKL